MSKNMLLRNFPAFMLRRTAEKLNKRPLVLCQYRSLSVNLLQNAKKEIRLRRHDVTASELAKHMNVNITPVIRLLEEYGYSVEDGSNTIVDLEIAEILADEFGYSIEKDFEKSDSTLRSRAPVVTIMGHVDHGKTTLLDHLRKSSVAQHEAGGITQGIGAFSVKVPGLKDTVTFVDTPGHAAFNSMRARGAKLTDIVVLVIAADDGIMEQTMECLRHIREADVPLIIAINKIDKPKSNPEKIKKELLSTGVQLQEFGGEVECISISALKGTNIDTLIVLLNEYAKVYNYTASYDAPVEAVVIETESNKQKGIISSLLIKQGLLKKGKVLLAGDAFAKVRQMFDANGNVLIQAGPSDPVQVLGWRSLPEPGDTAVEIDSEAEARKILKLKALDAKPKKVVTEPPKKAEGKPMISSEFKGGRSKRIPYRVSLRANASLGVKNDEEEKKQKVLNVLIKADVSGSLEAIVNVLGSFHSPDIQLNILNASVGSVTHTDLQVAHSGEGIVYSFNMLLPKDISLAAEKMNVSIRYFDIIYKLMDNLKEELESKLPLKIDELIVGEADVLKVFKLTGVRKNIAAGCNVKDGVLDADKDYIWRVIRNGDIMHEGRLKSLKRGVDDVTTAKKFTECGVTLKNFEDFNEGDQLQCMQINKSKQTIEWNL